MAKLDERIVESYAGLLGALNRVNREAPEIQELYRKAREEIETEKLLLREAREEARKLSKTLKQKIADADAVKAAYKAKIAEWNALQEEIKKQSGLWREQIAEAEALRQKIMSSEPLLNYRLDELTRAFDYDKSETVAAMYQHYKDVGPVIVRRPNWPVDTGFLVLSVRGNQVRGIPFKDGKPADSGSTPRASSLCRIFHGPSQREIFRYALRESQSKT